MSTSLKDKIYDLIADELPAGMQITNTVTVADDLAKRIVELIDKPKEDDALKAENEQLREVVRSLIDLHKVTLNEVNCGFRGYAGSVHYTEIIEAAKQALKETT